MGHEGSSLCLQDPTTGLYSESHESSLNPLINYLKLF
jgi:hypothetical protein